MQLFTEEHWFRGNLHTHTTASDGALGYSDAVEWYRSHGYSFVAVTDHDVCHPEGQYDEFVMVSGIELPHHTVGIGVTDWTDASAPTQQDEVNRIVEKGGLAVIAHPYWHSLTVPYLESLEGHIAMEVYNSECDHLNGRGYSLVHWDYLLTQGRKVYGVAVDDSHWRWGNEGKGFVMVNAASLTSGELMAQISKGRFYASQGPEIRQISLEQDRIEIECSPCQRINLITVGPGGRVRFAGDRLLEHGAFEMPDTANYVRFECVDELGRTAWSNPIWRPCMA